MRYRKSGKFRLCGNLAPSKNNAGRKLERGEEGGEGVGGHNSRNNSSVEGGSILGSWLVTSPAPRLEHPFCTWYWKSGKARKVASVCLAGVYRTERCRRGTTKKKDRVLLHTKACPLRRVNGGCGEVSRILCACIELERVVETRPSPQVFSPLGSRWTLFAQAFARSTSSGLYEVHTPYEDKSHPDCSSDKFDKIKNEK